MSSKKRQKTRRNEEKENQENEEPMSEGEEGELDQDVEPGGRWIDDIYIPPPPKPPAFSGEGTGRRLIITYIENYNFKSYAGRQMLGPFHKSFTSIVGPNGSGKSNVIDSMLFVFGYRAQRLRLKKLSHLIHNSDQHRDCRECRVTVHFALLEDHKDDPREKMDLVAGSEFRISRTAFKDGSSYYTINDKRCQFRDVANRLQEHGIDLKYNRFLILQGEVESIALMKSKADQEGETGLLEFFEEVIGSNRLKEPIAKLQTRLEELNMLRSEKVNRCKVIEKERNALEGPRNEALNYLRMVNKLSLAQNKLYQLNRHYAQEDAEKAKIKYDKARELYDKAMQQINDFKKQREEKEKEYQATLEEYQRVEKLLEEKKAAFEELERIDTEKRAAAKHTKVKRKKAEEELEKEKQRLEKLKKDPESFDEQIKKMETKEESLKEDLARAEEVHKKVVEEIGKDTEKLRLEKEKHETELNKLQASRNEARSKYEIAEHELELYLNTERTAKTELEQLQNKHATTKKNAEEAQRKAEECLRVIPEKKAEMTTLSEKLDAFKSKRMDVQEQLREIEHRLADARSAATAFESRNQTLNALMNAQKKGELSGIVGRLGDLGGIDKKYDVAISTACGPLDNIVCETMTQAQRCVQYMKHHNIRATTFIDLEKMTEQFSHACRQQISTPENCPRLFDLIKVNNERLLPAFYYALRDTLVATDLDQATRVAFGGRQRWRVVTLGGELIETTGAMSGGGRPSSGRMGTSAAKQAEVNPEELRALEEEALKYRETNDKLRHQCEELQREIEKLTADVRTLEKNAPNFQMTAKQLGQTYEELKKTIKQAEKRLEEVRPDKKRVKELETTAAKAKEELEKQDKNAQTHEEKVDYYKDLIKEVMDTKVGDAKRKLEFIKKNIAEVRSQITKLGVSRKTAERNIEKSEKRIESLQAEAEECEKQREAIKQELLQLEEQGRVITEEYEGAKNKKEEMEGAVKEVHKIVESIKKEEQKITSENVDAKHKMENCHSEYKSKLNQVRGWTEKLGTLEWQEVPGEMFGTKSPRRAGTLSPRSPKSKKEDQLPSTPTSAPKEGEGDVPMDQDRSNAGAENAESGGDAAASAKKKKALTREDLPNLDARFPIYPPDQLEDMDDKLLGGEIDTLEKNLGKMKPNMGAIKEYEQKERVYIERANDLEEVTSKRDDMKGKLDEVKNMRLTEFKTGFNIIARRLKEMYRMITLGGDADLEWVDSCDPYAEGILFSVRPNKKSWKQIQNLSGGEKTLSSLSLIFALHYYKPSPLYVMDEIDAALDFKNVSIVANYIKDRTKNTQFLIISLRNNMYELADRLVGIYKTHNCTKSVAFNPKFVTEKVEASRKKTVTLGSTPQKSPRASRESKDGPTTSSQQSSDQQQGVARRLAFGDKSPPVKSNSSTSGSVKGDEDPKSKVAVKQEPVMPQKPGLTTTVEVVRADSVASEELEGTDSVFEKE